MRAHFDNLSKHCENCTDGTCRTYAYSLAYLETNVPDINDISAVLEFLKTAPLSR